jgi:hypothetical protein
MFLAYIYSFKQAYEIYISWPTKAFTVSQNAIFVLLAESIIINILKYVGFENLLLHYNDQLVNAR